MNKYYDGTKLLSLKDINGNTPEIYICTTNRSGGKTTYFNRLCINRFKKYGEKFAILYRYKTELDNCADRFFKDIGNLFFKKSNMYSKPRSKGTYHELFFDDVSCGYVIAINSADYIKKLSHLFSDVNRIIFDEFQSETNEYCQNEVQKFISIHVSIARGGGKQSRYLPVYMIGNAVTILNPYYVALGISNRLNNNTKFLRGEGYVIEQGYIESAALAQKDSAFNRAFSNDKYMDYASQNIYLNDNSAFIEKPIGKNKYLCTVRYNDKLYAIRQYYEMGVLYCDDKIDGTFPLKISVTTADHNINYIMLKEFDYIISDFKFYFNRGCFRFKNMACKDVILHMLSY